MGETKRLEIVAGLKQDVDVEVNPSAAYECDGGPPKSTGYHVARCLKFTSPTLATKNTTTVSRIQQPRWRRHRGRVDDFRSSSCFWRSRSLPLVSISAWPGELLPSHRSLGRGPWSLHG